MERVLSVLMLDWCGQRFSLESGASLRETLESGPLSVAQLGRRECRSAGF